MISGFLMISALVLGYFAISGAAPYRKWVPDDDVADQRHMVQAAYVMVLLAASLAFCSGRLW